MSAAVDPRLFEILAAPAPALSCEEAERIAGDRFGVSGSANVLSGERDQNFRLRTADGRQFVLKVANPLEHPDVTDFQTQALLHIASRAADLPVPRVCRALSGATETTVDVGDSQRATVRLLTYLQGTPLSGAASTPELRARLGVCLALLGRALSDFSHPGADRGLLWDVSRAAALAELLEHIRDREQRSFAARQLDHYNKHVLPALPDLRWQVIYNDLNPDNVLVDADNPGRIAGIIDFGDMVRSPLVVDVAVAAAYQLRYTSDPFEAAAQLIAAYQTETPLLDEEIGLLFDLITTRLVVSVIITTWRAALHPENRAYILRSSASNWNMLRRIDKMSRTDVQQRLRAACESGRQRPSVTK